MDSSVYYENEAGEYIIPTNGLGEMIRNESGGLVVKPKQVVMRRSSYYNENKN